MATIDHADKKTAVQNSFIEGHKAGEEGCMKKFQNVIQSVRSRDELLLLLTKIGVYVAKCDGEFADEEKTKLDSFIGKVNDSPVFPEAVKKRILQIVDSEPTYEYIVSEMSQYLDTYGHDIRKELIEFVNSFIEEMIIADGCEHSSEQEFRAKWHLEFHNNEVRNG